MNILGVKLRSMFHALLNDEDLTKYDINNKIIGYEGEKMNEYRTLTKDVVNGDYVFGKNEAFAMILASRNGGPYELGFAVQPVWCDTQNNQIKFVADEEFTPLEDVVIMKEPQGHAQCVANNIKWDFLRENPTPTLREVRALNQKIINVQNNIKKESANEK